MEFYLLRTFNQVMSDGSFSGAGRTLGVTQSSVSQQIAKLEARVGAKLFQRVGHEIVPTETARELRRVAVSVLEQLREFEEKQQLQRSAPKGLVRYAMPESCQWTPHYKWVMAQLLEYPGIRTEVEVLPNARISAELLEGRLDFGFIVAEKPRPEFSYLRFSQERYSGVATRSEALEPVHKTASRQPLRLIKYPGADLYIQTWAKALGAWKRIKEAMERPTLEVGTLAGAIHAAKAGSGFAVIPTHCVSEELERGALLEWLPGRQEHPSNPIFLVRRHGERMPHRVEVVLELLRRSKSEV